MRDPSFVGYVKEADYHDATILSVDKADAVIRVRVCGYDERTFVSEFGGVRAVQATRPEGMMLYALSEMRSAPPLRRFVFMNWHDDDDAALEIDAETLRVYHELPDAT